MRTFLSLLVPSLLLAACSSSGRTDSDVARRETNAVVTANPNSTTPPPKAAQAVVEIQPVLRSDLAGLVGARECRFSTGPGTPVLLVARADERRGAAATGVMRIDGSARPLAAPNVEGFKGLQSDAKFAGTGVTVSLVRAPGQKMEKNVVAADVHVELTLGPKRDLHGLWRCA